MNKKETIKYIQNNNFDVQNANASSWAAELVFQSYVNSKPIHGVDFEPILSHFTLQREDFFYFYQIINLNTLRNIGVKIYSDYLRNPDSLKKKRKNHLLLEKKLDFIWREYKKTGNLKRFFKNIIITSQKWWAYAVIGEDKGEVINTAVVPGFAKRHNLELSQAREILSGLAHPEKPTILNSERISFLNICLAYVNKSRDVDKKIRDYIKMYFWVDTDFYRNQEVTKESILNKVKDEIIKSGKEGIIKELSDIDRNFKKLHQEKMELTKKIKLTKKDKKDIAFSNSIIEWVDQRKFGMMKDCYYLFAALSEVSQKYNIKYADFSSYAISEMFELLKSKKRVSDKEIKRRQGSIFLVNEKGKEVQYFYGDDAKELLAEVLIKQHSKGIKGAVASTGNEKAVSGIVSIVLDPIKEKFVDGAILVTSMTRVEFVPLMRRAKAIITNEGGIACHAAIVSRELGIPCIIGTKIATKNLKNGDKVEMDLVQGNVKIL